jgi:predicted lipoprotein with Yx(FWY)xxD motif
MRDDGRLQWARDGKPLYFFAGDAQPGDARGDGMSGAWHVLRLSAPRAAASSYDSRADYKY